VQVNTVLENVHVAFEVASTVAVIAASYVGLLIKEKLGEISLTQARDKAELLAHQNHVQRELLAQQAAVKESLTAHNAAVSQDLAVHVRADDERFGGITRTLERMERRMDRTEAKESK